MKNLISKYSQALALYSAENKVDSREFLIWAAEGINPMEDWDKYTNEELIAANLEWDEDNGGFSVENLSLQIEAFAAGE